MNIIIKLLKRIFRFDWFSIKNSGVYFLCNGEALPSILTDEEEKDLVERLDSGDIEAKNILIERNLRLVVYVAKRFENVDVDTEDLVSIGSFGLIKAINSYKGDKNIKIATYAVKCIENEILMYLRKISKQKNETSLDEPLNVDSEGNELVLYDLLESELPTPQVEMENTLEKQVLWQVLDKLNSRERTIMLMRFGLEGHEEMTQKEVADDLGISQSYISRLEKRIVVRIKKEMLKVV